MRRGGLIGKKTFISLILILFLILFLILMIHSYFDFRLREKIHTSDTKDMIDQRMKSLLFQMSIFPEYIGNELLFLSRLSSLKGVLDPLGSDCLGDLESDFLEFIERGTSYYQLRYINENGDEVVRVEYDGISHKIIPKDKLQNKKHRYYFKEASNLSSGEIYLSELDLNIEHKKIENRGTDNNPIYVPTLRIATPVFKKNGTRGGVVLLNIYADYFLDDIRAAQRDDEEIFLINKDGFYLSNPDKDKEFVFMFGGNANFFNDYPEVSKDTILDHHKRGFETAQNIFSFRYVHPTLGDVGLINISDKSSRDKSEEYYWVLVAVSDKEILDKATDSLKNSYFSFLLFLGTIIIAIIMLIFMLVFKTSFCVGRKRICA